jgi:hypothetical protein
MLRWTAAALACVVLIASGLLHGYWTERFCPAQAPLDGANRIKQLPLDLGDWHGEELPFKEGSAGAGVAGGIQRRYVHRTTGKSVSIALVCGRFGPVSIHTPDVCYVCSGFAVQQPRRSGDAGKEFWTSNAVKKGATDETHIRIYWAWNNGHGWKASADPRQEFAGSAVLYKLYVVREKDGPEEGLKEEPCEQFMRELLPALDDVLFGSASN